MTDVNIREAAVTMSMVDGDVLTPAQMTRIIAAVLAELRRQETGERSRCEDTVIAGSADGRVRRPS